MFRRNTEAKPPPQPPTTGERVTSVVGQSLALKGELSGSGGVRIEGSYEGEIALNGMLVVGESGKVTCEHVRANVVIVAGAVKGNISAEKVEIRKTGRVWGNVVTTAFTTEEGAFLRGQITMEDQVDLQLTPPAELEEPPPEQDDTAPLET
jgi:cytoskeletal protein CcmA (bactofilin family)